MVPRCESVKQRVAVPASQRERSSSWRRRHWGRSQHGMDGRPWWGRQL